MEMIILRTAHPKQVFTFQVNLVGAMNSDKLHANTQHFAACVNACISLLNMAGIAQKEAPCAAMTVLYDGDT